MKHQASASNGKKIWIDLDNSPHVLFINPVIRELKNSGYHVVVTARDFAQVCDLADMFQLEYKKVGRHFGKNKMMKAVGVVVRALEMLPMIWHERPRLAFSHGSRSMLLAAKCAGLPTLETFDYEHTTPLPFMQPTKAIVPEVLPLDKVYSPTAKIAKYPGIKEDVYTQSFEPDSTILQTLGIRDGEIVATVRPPATHAHYHNAHSEQLFEAIMERLASHENTRVVILPRIAEQKKQIRQRWHEPFQSGKFLIPEQVVNGLNLVWHSDFVVSGGGTMIREAAALNVPAYSFFRGTIGAVDRFLEQNDRLVLLQSAEDVANKLLIQSRNRPQKFTGTNDKVLRAIVDEVVQMVEKNAAGGQR